MAAVKVEVKGKVKVEVFSDLKHCLRRLFLSGAFVLCANAPALARNEVIEVLQTSPVAGFQHYAGPALSVFMQEGDALRLAREPDNPYDPRAVRVFWQGVQIGHAPRVDNVDLARLMDAGARVEGRILHLQKSRDPWKRVLMEIVLRPD